MEINLRQSSKGGFSQEVTHLHLKVEREGAGDGGSLGAWCVPQWGKVESHFCL